MALTWRQFHVYLDAFAWILQEETEDGRRKNFRADLRAEDSEPRLIEWKKKLREDTYRKLGNIG